MLETDDIVGRRSKVLVTGATGFIGSHLVTFLEISNCDLRIYSRQPYPKNTGNKIGEQNWFVGELDDQAALTQACSGVDTVFHLAGLANTGNRSAEEMSLVNCLGTQHVFSAAVLAGVKKFIYFSSILASEPEKSAYAASKEGAEQILLTYYDECPGTEVVILRPATVYGPGMRGNIKTFIRWARAGFLPSLSKLESTFPLISVKELCGVAMACATDDTSTKQSRICTLTDGERYTPARIEAAVYNHFGREPPKISVPRWLVFVGAVFSQFANISGIRKNQLGMSLYRNLIDSRIGIESHTASCCELPSTATFESELPAIIQALDQG